MRKLAISSVVVALLGLPVGLVTPGCSDNAGGNEDATVNETKGVVAPNTPRDMDEYARQRQSGRRR
jgi:hypothetical protein